MNQRYAPNTEPQDDDFTVSLTTTNKKADEFNERYLNALRERYACEARVTVISGWNIFQPKPSCGIKSCSKIMLLNNDQKNRWVNGSIGIIEAVEEEEKGGTYLLVRLRDNDRKMVSVAPFTWEVYRFSVLKGKSFRSPWEASLSTPSDLHSGRSLFTRVRAKPLTGVVIDIGRGTFASGQIYVAAQPLHLL